MTSPDLASFFSPSQNFSKGANFSYILSRSLPIKIVSAYFPLDYHTAPDPINCVHNLVARFHNFEIILLIVLYKYSNLVIDTSRSDSGTRLCSTGLITWHGWVVHFQMPKMVRRRWFVRVNYQLPKGNLKSARLALTIHVSQTTPPSHAPCLPLPCPISTTSNLPG